MRESKQILYQQTKRERVNRYQNTKRERESKQIPEYQERESKQIPANQERKIKQIPANQERETAMKDKQIDRVDCHTNRQTYMYSKWGNRDRHINRRTQVRRFQVRI